MTYVSSVQAPDRNRFLKVHQWQSDFCGGDFCATMLLAHFQSWHDWKLNHDEYYAKANNIAENHGDGRPHCENALLFFSTEDLSDAIFGAYGRHAINKAIDLLVDLKAISIHKNPNVRYHFDRTRYFRFHVEILKQWIRSNYNKLGKRESKSGSSVIHSEPDFLDVSEVTNRSVENDIRSSEVEKIDYKESEFTQKPEQTPDLSHVSEMTDRCVKTDAPCVENDGYKNNTYNKTKINKLTAHAREDNFNSQSQKPQNDLNEVTEKLIELGLSKHKVFSDESIDAIEQVLSQGATVSTFVEAYERSVQATEGSFGMRYLIKSVQSILNKATQRTQAKAKPNSQIDRQDNPKTSAQTQNAGSPDKINPYPWVNPMAAKEWLDFEALGVSLNLNPTQKVDEDQGGAQS